MHLGLRARIVAVLVCVSVLTLGVAAFTLLQPLEQRLRNNSIRSFEISVRNERGALESLPSDDVARDNPRLLRVARLLARHNGAELSVLRPDGTVLVRTDPDSPQIFVTAAQTAATNKGHTATVQEGGRPEAEITFPLVIHGERVIVAARKPTGTVQEATGVVRRAFTVAALAGLLGALLVGSLLAGRLVSRIRRLRDTTLRVSELGPEAELSPDRGRDEIGDLSRAFATMQQRLREQEQARRAFVATASHELRTPLTSLQVMLDLLNEDLRLDPPDIESARAQSASAEAQVQRLSSLAADLLDLSRIDAGIPLRTELVEVGAIVRSVTAELEVRAGTHIDIGRRSRGLGRRRSRERRPDRAHPARQRARARRARRARPHPCRARRRHGSRRRRGPRARRARGRPRPHLPALRARRRRQRGRVRPRPGDRARARAPDGRRPHPRGRAAWCVLRAVARGCAVAVSR